ncbi:MAG: 30S ribosomal protein S8 [Proteobacteria bacterium]|nr:30S ribosomal protein S8 [Pseudomonadota bacterium]
MNINDPIGDLIARIKNAQLAGKTVVNSPSSKLRKRVLEVLKKEGYIKGFDVKPLRSGIEELEVHLKYYESQPVIKKFERVSKPGRRVYSQCDKLQPYYNGLGITILSTSKGVITDVEARSQKVGGEVLCRIF